MGLVCLLPAAARASPESDAPAQTTKHELLERRLFLPALLGFGAGTTVLGVGTSAGQIMTEAGGIFSYTGGDASSAGSKSHLDSFAF
ncbi:MAG TPA: hypothetical protein VGH28_09760, partial [Polyangiaceae bacterium]